MTIETRALDRLSQPQQQADILLYRLHLIQITAGSLVVRLCEQEFGITRREWRLLSFLATKEGALSSELAEHAMLDRARTSRALTRLADKGLVRREPKPSDRREVHVYLSEKGRALYAAMYPRVVAINRSLASALSTDECAALDGMLDRLQAQADAMRSAGG